MKVLLPNERAEELDREGALKEIANETKATVHLHDAVGGLHQICEGHRLLTLRGQRGAEIQAAVQAVLAKVKGRKSGTELKVLLPRFLASVVIGKRGANIKELQRETGTNVQVEAGDMGMDRVTTEFPAAKPLDQEAFAEFVAKFRGELHCPGAFEPKLSTVRQQLLAHLSLSESASIKEMTGFKGGLNQGIWIVSDYSQKLVLKQTRCQRIAVNVMTEAENFVRIARDHPEITNDPMIAFPVILGLHVTTALRKIFSCIGPEGKISDVIAMKKCPGERLCEFVAHKFYANQMSQLTHALELVGQSLSQFHFRYGHEQHGDFQPSNIYYEESTDTVTFIDVGGMGVPTLGGDVDHFHQCIRAMTSSYQANLFVELLRAFDKGYQSPCTPRLQQGFRALR
eukprot:g31215.t1